MCCGQLIGQLCYSGRARARVGCGTGCRAPTRSPLAARGRLGALPGRYHRTGHRLAVFSGWGQHYYQRNPADSIQAGRVEGVLEEVGCVVVESGRVEGLDHLVLVVVV